jgi:enamine deaminase RidA (YjgF/YER057c/UK114 family)
MRGQIGLALDNLQAVLSAAGMGLGDVVRLGVYTTDVDEALKHFGFARKINSRRLIHQIEYGRTLAMMGRDAEARTEIQKGLDMPNREADDKDSRERGRKTLDSL